ncbi:MAG: ABC transporter permease [Sulfolobales archaeon]
MGFASYISRKAAQLAVVMAIGIIVSFFMFRLLPGDPTASLLDPRLDPEAKIEIIRRFGLDKPLYEQFILYITNILRGDFGISFSYTGMSVSEVIFGQRLINTLALMSTGIALSAVIGTLLGLAIGWRSGGILDRTFTGLLYMVFSAPVFWVALLIQFYLGYQAGLIPISGTSSYIGVDVDFTTYLADYMLHMVGPVITLAFFFIPSYYIYIRNVVSSMKGEDFVVTLRAVGLSERIILVRHIARHVAIHTLTITSNQSPLLVTGAVFTETVFGWNGIGRLLYDSILRADYPVLQGIFILTILVVVITNIVTDVIYYIIDPRIKVR